MNNETNIKIKNISKALSTLIIVILTGLLVAKELEFIEISRNTSIIFLILIALSGMGFIGVFTARIQNGKE